MIRSWLKKRRDEELAVAEHQRGERELERSRREQELAIQVELGIHGFDPSQAWLRLHQLLKSHEDRIAALEKRK